MRGASPAHGASGWLRSAGETVAVGIAGALVGRRFPSTIAELRRAQWLPAADLAARTEARLAPLLRHAAGHVPFYREAYRRLGIPSGALRTLTDLRALPVLDKATFLQGPPERFLADDIPAHARVTRATSGSTGEPFTFSLDRNKLPLIFASHLFYDSWYGLLPFHRTLRIGSPSSPASPLPADMPTAFRFRQAVSGRLQHLYERLTLTKIPLWSFDDQQAAEIHQRIETLQPAFVYSGASTLAALSDIAQRLQLRLSHPPRGVISIAETLTPHRRSLIEGYFRAPIVNRYGLREQGYWCAQSCPEAPDNFHVNTELTIIEVVRPDGSPAAPGETGRLLLTDLFNYSMPFIRYETGDLGTAAAEPCPCGRGFPRLGPIEGRSHECIRTPSGKIVTPARWSHFLFVHKSEYVDVVRQYQLHWHPPDRAHLLIVPTERFDGDVTKRLRDDVAWLLGDDVAVSVEVVAEIRPEVSGKRPIIKVMAPS